MTTSRLENKNLYFYLYIAVPLVVLLAYYFNHDDLLATIIFYVIALIFMYLDKKTLCKSEVLPKSELINPTIMVIIFPPAYVYWRASDEGMKKWRWLFLSLAITIGSIFASTEIANDNSIKTTACEITTSIFKDKNSDVTCLAVDGMKKIADRHYRANAILSNGMDMPITIEERDNGYIYVTLSPLSNLLD